MAKTCVKLLCEDPAFSEYIKCILMDERTFLNNNVAYTFLNCFLHKVQKVFFFNFAVSPSFISLKLPASLCWSCVFLNIHIYLGLNI